ncbi:MAG: purine-binding chemotaxis protein CheW [Eubacterium sp.]|nr:purine-binding chemotaxis protein CheW [Eubacterium sp.]
MDNKYILFTLDGETYAVDILGITSIEEVGKPTPVPRAPKFLQGIINLRDNIIPVVNLRYVLGYEKKSFEGEKIKVLITRINDVELALSVDEVVEIYSPSEEIVADVPKLAKTPATEYADKILKKDNGVVIVISTTQLLSKAEQDEVDAVLERYN